MTDALFVDTRDEIATIEPNVYGHFVEHLGRCIYGGLWVGEDDPLATTDGVRDDAVALLADLDVPLLRWPGGCFADDYHWEDGVGPREERPRRRNLWWTQGRANAPEESNAFGTDEFLALCERLGAEPYLAANVGSGSPDEAVNWVEYCNYDGDTDYADLRRDHGREEPYGVTYWGVGNENWGCGGRFDPTDYAREYRRFANYLSGYDNHLGEAGLELVACGHTTESWNREFLEGLDEAANLVDLLSVHRYYEAGDATDFDDEEYYEMFGEVARLADDVERTASTIDAIAPAAGVDVVVDEWGVWHPDATGDDGLEQDQTVRDALSAAATLDVFNASADVVRMANVAQTVNVLQCLVMTDEAAAWATPTYRVFDLYRPHAGATALRTDVETDARAIGDDREVALANASASATDDGAFVTVTNRDLDERSFALELPDGDLDVADAQVLFAGADPAKRVTRDNADEFVAESLRVEETDDGTAAFDLPGSSVAGVRFA